MNPMTQALLQGFRSLWRYRKMWWWLYAATLLAAMLVAYPAQRYLDGVVGQSLVAQDLIRGFDLNFLTDLMNHHGDGLAVIVSQSLLVLALFYFLMVFFTGGVVGTLVKHPERFQSAQFWADGAVYFWRMLALALLFLAIHALLVLLFLQIYLLLTHNFSREALETEVIIFSAPKILLPIYACLASLVFVWQDYSKVFLVEHNRPWPFRAMRDAWGFLQRKPWASLGLYTLNLLLLAAVWFVNYWLTSAFEIQSGRTILLSFLLSQGFLIARLGLRVVNWGSIAAWVRS